MTIIPTILWWALLPFILKYSFKKNFPVVLIYIYLIISGRLPLPININFELWMLYGVIFIPLYLKRLLSLDYIPILRLLSFASILITAFISSLVLGSYNDGYLLLCTELIFMIGYITHWPSSSAKTKILSDEVKAFFVISVALISLIGLIVQLMIAFNIVACANFAIYHPWQDIHCIPLAGFTIYRLSIGSNINEFSLYLSIALIILLFSRRSRENEVKHLLIYRRIIILILCIAGLLSLSRALTLTLVLCIILRICMKLVITSQVKLTLSAKVPVKYWPYIVITIIGVLLMPNIVSFDLINQFELNQLGNRFSFVLNPQELLEGVSSRDRLDSLERTLESVTKLSLFPTLKLGEATFLHNTFLQYMLEYGLFNATIGLVLLFYSVPKNAYISIALLVYMGSHHVLYNPILYIGWFIVSQSKTTLLSTKTNFSNYVT